MNISPEFSQLLRAGRHELNSRVAQARHRYPAFSTELFSHFLTVSVDPLVRAVGTDHRGTVASIAFDLALELVGKELCTGNQSGRLINRLWQSTLPALAPILPPQPAALISSLCNALLNLEAQGARTEQWLQLMQLHGPKVTAEKLCELGLLTAWRAGAAQFRPSALRVAANFPEIAKELFGIDEASDFTATLKQLQANPWLLTAANSNPLYREVGAFTGFGGAFVQPPQVRACEEGFLVHSGDQYFFLLADSFGEIMLPASFEEFQTAKSFQPSGLEPPQIQDGRFLNIDLKLELKLDVDSLQLAWNAHTAALYSPHSFSIWVFPRW